MGKPWFVFFARAPRSAEMALRCVAIVFLIFLLHGNSLAFAKETESSTSVKPPAAQSAPDISLLPAFDLEYVVRKPTQSAATDQGTEPQAQATSIQVGDQLELKVLGLQIPGIQNPSKELSPDLSEASTLQEQGWTVEASSESLKAGETDLRMKAVPLKPGKLTLPALVLKNAEGRLVGRTNPLTLDVGSVIHAKDAKPQEPEGLEPPVGLQFPWWIIIFAFLLGVLLLAGGGYGLYRWIRSRKPTQPQKPVVIRSEDEVALEKLSELARAGLIEKGEFKVFYFRLSEILKVYVGARYRFDAPESTTREMLSNLESKRTLEDALIDRLEEVFNQLDLVKFTDHVPAREGSSHLLSEAREFVMLTRRPPSSSLVAEKNLGASTHAL